MIVGEDVDLAERVHRLARPCDPRSLPLLGVPNHDFEVRVPAALGSWRKGHSRTAIHEGVRINLQQQVAQLVDRARGDHVRVGDEVAVGIDDIERDRHRNRLLRGRTTDPVGEIDTLVPVRRLGWVLLYEHGTEWLERKEQTEMGTTLMRSKGSGPPTRRSRWIQWQSLFSSYFLQ